IHPIFYVSLLNKFTSDPPASNLPTPLRLDEKGLGMQPQMLLRHHMIKVHGRWQEQVLIKWQGMPEEDALWEAYENMKQQYPNFHLEGKFGFNGESIDVRKGSESPARMEWELAKNRIIQFMQEEL
ncbi:hypothetical protein S245_013323, partial [Arachis hypogaea]